VKGPATRARRFKLDGRLAYVACIRYKEVLVLQGSPLLGACFALGAVNASNIASLVIFSLASTLLVAHIFTLNDWAGVAADANDPNKSSEVFLARGVSRREVAVLSLCLLASSLVLCTLLPRRTLLLAVVIAALGVCYSHPSINAKGIPVISSTPHLLGGLLHFLFGYSLFSPIDRRGVLMGLFFAVTFTAGHLNQEVRDYDGDRINGLLTNAVAFGKTAAFAAGFVGFTLAYADLLLLARAGILPASLGVLPIVLYPVHVLGSVWTIRAGLTFASVSRFQSWYRLLYAVIGMAMLATVLSRWL
jgi:lycopene elongase/hydratase (dihydrobisanhydrobacterioruberin-forming)